MVSGCQPQCTSSPRRRPPCLAPQWSCISKVPPQQLQCQSPLQTAVSWPPNTGFLKKYLANIFFFFLCCYMFWNSVYALSSNPLKFLYVFSFFDSEFLLGCDHIPWPIIVWFIYPLYWKPSKFNNHLCESLCIPKLLRHLNNYYEVWLLNHIGRKSYILCETPKMSPKVETKFYISSSNCWQFLLLHILQCLVSEF